MSGTRPAASHEHAPRPDAPQDAVHVPFVLVALASALAVGLTLAVSLPLQVLVGGVDAGWLAHVQVHGHAQVIGFAGLFVLGVGARLAPRFAGRPLAYPRLLGPTLWLIAAGLLARVVGQPLAAHEPFALLLIAGGALEAAGALAALTIFSATVRPLRRDLQPHVFLLWAALVWLALQALLGAWWLTELALEGQSVLPGVRNTVLLHMQVWGMLLAALAGVGLRSFPTFMGARPPGDRPVWAIALLLELGLALWVVGLLVLLREPAASPRLAAGGQLLVGAGTLGFVVSTGWWGFRHRLAAASRGLAWALRTVLASLTLTALLLTTSGAQALLEGRAVDFVTQDATRHVFLLGVVTLGMLTMGQLILPEFASERFVRRPGWWRGPYFAGALGLATVLRGVLPWLGLDAPARYWAMGLGGLLALAAVATFAVLFVRARRAHGAYLARVGQWQRGGHIPLREVSW